MQNDACINFSDKLYEDAHKMQQDSMEAFIHKQFFI